MEYTALKEIIAEWDDNQLKATHILLGEGEALEDIIETINDYAFSFYTNLEEYIIDCIENLRGEFPSWICLDIVETYKRTLRYEDSLIFVDDTPAWAEGGDEYGTSEEQIKYWSCIKYLCNNSEILKVYR